MLKLKYTLIRGIRNFADMWKYLLGVTLILGCLACSEEEEAPPNLDFMENPTESGVESFGVVYYFSDSAKVTSRLYARHVIEKEEGEGKEQETIHYLKDSVHLHFLDSRGRSHSEIKAREGVFNREAGLAELKQDVYLSNRKGESLETEKLFWDKEKDSVYTDVRVRIQTPDKVIIGREGFRSNTDFTGYTIFGIEGELETEEN